MPAIHIVPDIDTPGANLEVLDRVKAQNNSDALTPQALVDQGHLIEVNPETGIEIAGLSHGTTEGSPAVWIILDLGDGKAALAQTTLKAFLITADALKARLGDPR